MRGFKHFLPPAWWTAGTRGVESLSACTAVYWAVILALPLNSFDVSPSFDNLQALATEPAWAVIYGLIGALQLVALAIDHYQSRLAAAVCAAVLWCMTAVSIIETSPASTTPGVYMALALGCLWTLIRGPSRHTTP